MAGIGFELRRILSSEPGLLSRIRAYACAGLISSGPWIMTMLGVWMLSLFRSEMGGQQQFDNFRALVTYAFAFSLLTVGALQMAVTRQLADGLYRREYEKILPAFSTMVAGVGALQTAVGVTFCVVAGFGVPLTFVFTSLYVVISLTWVTLIWLSVIRQFDKILAAYILGLVVSWAAMQFLGGRLDLVAALAAYAAGQAFTLVLLARLIVQGTEAAGQRDFRVFQCIGRYPELVLVGLFYSAAIWIDKMAFWFMEGMGAHPLIRFHPLYDTCCFLAYMTVLPALALNLIHFETKFYEHYRGYYSAVLHGLPLKVLEDKREAMVENLREGAIRLLRIQGAITCLCIIMAPAIVNLLELPEAAVRVFRLSCLGALFHVMLLIANLVLLYFDLRKQALVSCLVFLVLNGVFAVISVHLGVETYGLGYALASMISLILAFSFLTSSLRDLDYLTFSSQPKVMQKSRS